MATQEQIEYVLRELPRAHPAEFFKIFNDSNAGIGFALKLLNTAEKNRLSAGAISEAMGVSTARVAVIIKKMESRGLITKESYWADARVTLVCLSDEGKALCEQMRANMSAHISAVIDRIGMEKLRQFIELSVEVKEAMRDYLDRGDEPFGVIDDQ